jgi:hypothetical protein
MATKAVTRVKYPSPTPRAPPNDDGWQHGAPASDSVPPGIRCRSGLEGIEFVEDSRGIAIELGGRHDTEPAVTGLEYGDADHEGGREIPCAGMSGFEGLWHLSAPVRGRGPSPLDRRPMCPASGRCHRAGAAGAAARWRSGPFTG